jgi:hypothetical protein
MPTGEEMDRLRTMGAGFQAQWSASGWLQSMYCTREDLELLVYPHDPSSRSPAGVDDEVLRSLEKAFATKLDLSVAETISKRRNDLKSIGNAVFDDLVRTLYLVMHKPTFDRRWWSFLDYLIPFRVLDEAFPQNELTPLSDRKRISAEVIARWLAHSILRYDLAWLRLSRGKKARKARKRRRLLFYDVIHEVSQRGEPKLGKMPETTLRRVAAAFEKRLRSFATEYRAGVDARHHTYRTQEWKSHAMRKQRVLLMQSKKS